MASEIVLKPCPCCGGHATMEHGAERSENGWVVCMECGLSTRYHHDPAEAAAEWNRRACDVHHETPSTVHNGDCVPQTERNAAATGEKPEVADAVIAEMRDEAARADTEQYYTLDDAAESMREYANRLEAALKRERAAFDCECAGIAELAAKEEAARHKPGNAAAMREALERVVEIADREWKSFRETPAMKEMRDVCTSALSAPARQCDVGTAEEQVRRFSAFCDLSKSCRSCPVYKPNFTAIECFAQWAQTPYEAKEGGKGDGV